MLSAVEHAVDKQDREAKGLELHHISSPASIPVPPGGHVKHDCPRQGSSASSDTYASCFTHLQSSPSQCETCEMMTPDSFRNVYVNPLDPDNEGLSPAPSTSPPVYEEIFQGDIVSPTSQSAQYSHTQPQAFFPPGSPSRSINSGKTGPNQIVQLHDDGMSASWKRQPSPKAIAKQQRSSSKDQSSASALRQMFKNKKQKSPKESSFSGKPKPRFHTDTSTDSTWSQSSTESVHSQGSARPASGGIGGRFRKKPFARQSPSTGKKLANYHLIANSQSGGSSFFLLIILSSTFIMNMMNSNIFPAI